MEPNTPENEFTLDAMRADLESRYAPCHVTLSDGRKVELRGLLRLRKDKRRAVKALLGELEKAQDTDTDTAEDSLDQLDKIQEVVEQILANVASDPTGLLDDLDGDVELEMAVLNRYLAETQTGEASSSPNSSTSTAGTSSPTSESDTESTVETSSPTFLAPA
jgi:hypothetical protein